ncbi:MAG: tail fiber domain-containing protein [Planctomycetota bacterium]|nr:MAG: tail fiber domain-containing protein [Planctomycetota bacterium]
MRHCPRLAALLAITVLHSPAAAQESDLTYQGQLLESGAAADGTYTAVFTLWDADTGGSQVGPTNIREGLVVTNGLLTAQLDFGADAFNGARWLEIAVDGQTLTPRQKMTSAPKATRLEGVNNAPNGRFGINTSNPAAKWHVEQDDGIAIYGQSLFEDAIVGVTATNGKSALWGISSAPSGYGVRGLVDSSPGTGAGVFGSSFADQGVGVFGQATNSAGAGDGVVGTTAATQSHSAGVRGIASSASGTVHGGYFVTESLGNGASGLVAQATSNTGTTFGVQASVSSPGGIAVSGYVAPGSGGYAVRGNNGNSDGYAGYFIGRGHFRDHTSIGKTGVKVSSAEWFGVHTTAESGQYGGMYISGQNAGAYPFYGYSASGVGADAWHYFDGIAQTWNLNANGNRLSVNRSNGYVGFGDSSPDYPLDMASGARCTTGGVWTNASSREWKHEFQSVDARDILDRLTALPITEWTYKTEDGVRHLGPVAEDFAAAFGLGDDAQTIGTIDADGVALAAIQGLNQIVLEKDAEIAALRDRMTRLEAMVEALAADRD